MDNFVQPPKNGIQPPQQCEDRRHTSPVQNPIRDAEIIAMAQSDPNGSVASLLRMCNELDEMISGAKPYSKARVDQIAHYAVVQATASAAQAADHVSTHNDGCNHEHHG